MKQQTTSLQQQWLQAQHAMASRQPLRPRQPLCIDDQQIGSIEEDFARKLGQELLAVHEVDLQSVAGQWLLKGAGGASVGFGARMGYGKHLTMRLDWANVIDSAGNQAKNDQMVNVTVAVQF